MSSVCDLIRPIMSNTLSNWKLFAVESAQLISVVNNCDFIMVSFEMFDYC